MRYIQITTLFCILFKKKVKIIIVLVLIYRTFVLYNVYVIYIKITRYSKVHIFVDDIIKV
ncbi:hypothetical protein bcgnr5411_44300 [Bacillus cereus]